MEREREADERRQLELVVVWANNIILRFYILLFLFRTIPFQESTDTYMMYDAKIYGTHGTDMGTSITIIFYIQADRACGTGFS
jgi:hypothetical protein